MFLRLTRLNSLAKAENFYSVSLHFVDTNFFSSLQPPITAGLAVRELQRLMGTTSGLLTFYRQQVCISTIITRIKRKNVMHLHHAFYKICLFVTRPGFEPRQAEPESAVLPLYYRAISLAYMDSNHDKQYQKLSYYRYTIGQFLLRVAKITVQTLRAKFLKKTNKVLVNNPDIFLTPETCLEVNLRRKRGKYEIFNGIGFMDACGLYGADSRKYNRRFPSVCQ